MKQDLRSFLRSKTNWGTMIYLAFHVYGYATGQSTFQEMGQQLSIALIAFGMRDAVHA